MIRGLQIVAFAVMGLSLAFVGLRALRNPYDARREALAAELEHIDPGWRPEAPANLVAPNVYEGTIKSHSTVWNMIVEPPKAAVAQFDINAALKGIQVTRQSVGEKVKIVTQQNPKGDWYAVGQQINGCTITEITRAQVTFSAEQNGKTYTKVMPR